MAARFLTTLTALMLWCATAAAVQMRPDAWRPGEAVPADYPANAGWVAAREIDDATFARMKGGSYGAGCSVPRADLRLIEVVHHDGHGARRMGEMVCNRAIADDLVEIFRELYIIGYPIERMVLIDEYDADDERSMTANNTSCFNHRRIAGSRRLSKHATGMAVDINPLYNPWVRHRSNGTVTVSPAAGAEYVERELGRSPYMINPGDTLVRIFKAHGFRWGGDWGRNKDYQHFEK